MIQDLDNHARENKLGISLSIDYAPSFGPPPVYSATVLNKEGRVIFRGIVPSLEELIKTVLEAR